MSTKRTNKKMLAARVLCTLLLGTYLTGGYGEQVAWGASAESTQIFEDGAHGDKSKVASAWGSNTTANDTASTAFGANTKASGEYSTAFGNGTVASGSIATAWGNSAKAYGPYSTAFGKGTAGDKDDNNKGELATAWGDSTVASGDTATVWGYHAKASGDFSTAFGFYTKASGKNSTAFGDTTEARGENATAWGLKAKAYGVNATSSGYDTVAGGDGATAFGGGAMALGFYSTAWGYYTQAGQLLYGSDKKVAYIVDYTEGGTTKYKIVDYNNPETTLKGGFNSYWEAYSECDVKNAGQATAWGAGTKALAGNATAFGNGSIASGIRSTAFGWFTEASGEGSTTWGIDSVASGNGATAWGGYTAGMNQVKGGTASGDASTAFGVETIANTKGSTAWGDQTLAGKATIDGTEYSGTYATAFGYGTKASGTYATAFGSLTTASGPVATAWGVGTKASGNRSTAFGDNTTASGFAATAWGTFAIASGDYSTAFGYGTQAGQLLYGAENTEATIERYTKDGETKYRIVNASDWSDILDNNGGTGFASYEDAFKAKGLTRAGKQATAFGKNTKATGDDSTAFGVETVASGEGATAWGGSAFFDWKGGTASDAASTAFGIFTEASGQVSTAFGASTKADGLAATAFGIETEASGRGSTAWGNKSVAGGDYSTAFGDSSQALAENSLAALGGVVEKDATNGVAIGKGAKVTVADAVALGSDSVASREAGATDAYLKTDSDTGNAWVSTHNAIAVGDDANVTRQITGVAAGSKDTDAVNVAQLKKVAEGAVYTGGDSITIDNSAKTVSVKKDGVVESGNTGIVTGGTVYTALQNEARVTADGNYIKSADSAAKNLEALDTAVGTTADGNYVKASDSVGENLGALDAELAALTAGTGTGLAEVSHRIDNMDSKVEKVGAGAAALAALHPMDTDGKFSMAAGFGNYRSANAMALGLFYRPTDQVMFSMGGSMGNGENMINAGVSFALDKGISTSKAAMARTIKAQGEKISEQDAKIQTLEAENAKLAERLAAIEAKLGK